LIGRHSNRDYDTKINRPAEFFWIPKLFKLVYIQNLVHLQYELSNPPGKMKLILSFVLSFAIGWSASAETVVKILHINKLPKVQQIWKDAAATYEKDHPGVKVQFDYLENEAYKAKLPTLLQSKDRPSVFHSWGGGVMYEQIGAGVCQDISKAIGEGGFKDSFYPAGVQNFSYDGKSYGLPNDVGPMVFWYNKDLAAKAGVDPTTFKTWDDFLAAVKKCKDAGLTPIAVGGGDKWPMHFYPALLMMRILGKDGMDAAYKGSNGGFAGPDVVKAWKMFKDLCGLQPFQKGFEAAKYADSAGYFHDGKAVFHLMGTWDKTEGRTDAADQKGLSDAQLGWFFFPEVTGGKGKANDIFASVNGWLVSKDAPKETVDFMKVWLGKDVQTKLAQEGLMIPMVKGTAAVIQDAHFKAIANEVENSNWIGIAIDQLLGPDTGRVFNDETMAVAAGSHSPEEATKTIEQSFAPERQQ
jgi:raffinose/stachyose/melibiose transport system substrate-binding protein